MRVCLQEFDQIVGLERFEMVVELVEEVFTLLAFMGCFTG